MGIGVDIINIVRVERLWNKYNFKFAKKILTKNEIVIMNKLGSPARFIAKRFAAKEAIVKALGVGFRDSIWFTDLEINNDKLGKPCVRYLGRLQDNNDLTTELSISDEKDYAVAFCVISPSTLVADV